MFSKATIWIAVSYLTKSIDRRTRNDAARRHYPLLAAVAAMGVALGLSLLIAVLSVMNGFDVEVARRLMGLDAHLVVESEDSNALPSSIEITSALRAATKVNRVVEGEVVLRNYSGGGVATAGVRLLGVEELPMSDYMDIHRFGEADWRDGLLIGSDVMDSVSALPGFISYLEVIAPMADIGPSGDFVPRRLELPLAGYFKSGIHRYDGSVVFTSLKIAERALGMQARSRLEVNFTNPLFATSAVKKVTAAFPGLKVRTWQELNKRLFSALRLERFAMSLLMFLTILISSFSIAGATSMFVSARRRDIAILRTLGMKKEDVRAVFLIQGSAIGITGAVLGVILGFLICIILSRWPIELPSTYYLNYLPVRVDLHLVIVFFIASVFLSVMSAWVPVRTAVLEDPVSVLRYE